jgi:hypothetical protein
MVVVGVIGMFVLSRFHFRNQIPLKDNYFWLLNRYYLRVAESSFTGLVLYLQIIFAYRKGVIDSDGPTIAAICVIGSIKVLFTLLAIRAYWKTRQVKNEHKKRYGAEKPQTEDPYVQMLLGFASIPGWHILLSTLLIWLVTTGFITIPPELIGFAEENDTGDGQTSLFKQFALSEPQYVQFHFTTPPLDFIIRRIWFSEFSFILSSDLFFTLFFHSVSVLMLTNHQVRDLRLDILRRLYRDVCALLLSIFEQKPFLALPQLLSAHGRGWHLWGDLIPREL